MRPAARQRGPVERNLWGVGWPGAVLSSPWNPGHCSRQNHPTARASMPSSWGLALPAHTLSGSRVATSGMHCEALCSPSAEGGLGPGQGVGEAACKHPPQPGPLVLLPRRISVGTLPPFRLDSSPSMCLVFCWAESSLFLPHSPSRQLSSLKRSHCACLASCTKERGSTLQRLPGTLPLPALSIPLMGTAGLASTGRAQVRPCVMALHP